MASTKVLGEQTIYDLCISIGYTLDNAIYLIEQNQQINNIDANLYDLLDRNISYQVITGKPVDVVKQAPASSSTLKTIVGRDSQSVYDIALMTYGSLDGIVELINSNKIYSVDYYDYNKVSVTYDTNKVVDSSFANYLKNTRTVIVTGDEYQGTVYLLADEMLRLITTESGYRIIIG